MRRTVLAGICGLLCLSGCADRKTIGGVTYDVYGIVNMNEKHNPNIQYEISVGSIIVASIFLETGIVPLYILGWDLWEPVGPKAAIVGQVSTP